jgi:hypothetical protein
LLYSSIVLINNSIMLSTALTVALLAVGVIAHGDHAEQKPVAGPHKSLWYNTLPGDGGTQVCQLAEMQVVTVKANFFSQGRLGLFWYLNIRPPAIFPMPRER